ncbi:MAG TPA: FKBP-type peptidyl-prolyl cis-trans isomerase [Marmoricola sp.]|nr:FKBP-type peptidyl-prolyl cis-trans isomerase [Marmoricola sp.]
MTKICLALTGLLLCTVVAGCGSEGSPPSSVREKVSVEGEFGAKPTIDIDAPLEFSDSTSWTTEKGDGDPVGSDAVAILALTIADGTSGETAISTLDQGQGPLEVQLGDQVFPSLVDALTDRPAGSRVVVASVSDDAYGEQGAPQIGIKPGDPVVMVADVLSTDPTTLLDGPTGAEVTPPATAPRLLERDGVPTGFDVRGASPPGDKLMVVPLREGDGPAIEAPERVAVHYLGAVWGSSKPFDESYSKEPARFSIGLGGVIKGWDQGLDGVKEGARLMLVVPPGLGYGATARPGIPANSTLVFVVDVLGVG